MGRTAGRFKDTFPVRGASAGTATLLLLHVSTLPSGFHTDLSTNSLSLIHSMVTFSELTNSGRTQGRDIGRPTIPRTQLSSAHKKETRYLLSLCHRVICRQSGILPKQARKLNKLNRSPARKSATGVSGFGRICAQKLENLSTDVFLFSLEKQNSLISA